MLYLNVQKLPLFLWHFVPQSSPLSGDLGNFLVRITSCLLQQSFAPMDQAVALPNWTPPSHFGLILAGKSLCQTLFFSWPADPHPPTCSSAFLSQHPLEWTPQFLLSNVT
jgi:hypothetical protein